MREFKIIVLRKFSELKRTQTTQIRKTIHEQKERSNKEKFRKLLEILELKNIRNENVGISRRLDQAEERINELRNRSFEIIQSTEKKELKE